LPLNRCTQKISTIKSKIIYAIGVLDKFEDMESSGNFLSINFNECSKYNAINKTVAFKIMHPNWSLPSLENETKVFEIPFQMQLNATRFAKNYIYTAGIDCSVRVMSESIGSLITAISMRG
jgi:hypothetical protein